jgi:hypothetical protein
MLDQFFVGFAHRTTLDGQVESICRKCFLTIAKEKDLDALEKPEAEHICSVYYAQRDKASRERMA